MWHYVEGLAQLGPRSGTNHGIRILPGPSSLWLDATRQAASRRRTSPASTPSARWRTSAQTGHDYSWFVLTQKIIEKEFALSGSEQNPDLTGKDSSCCSAGPAGGRPAPSRRSSDHGEDFVVADTLDELVAGHERAHR